jgi:glycosyltransferase involved in cell wall biosynthesis
MKTALIVPDREFQRGGVADYARVVGDALSSLVNVEPVRGCAFTAYGARAAAQRIARAGCGSAVLQYTPNLYRWRSLFPVALLFFLRRRNIRTLTVFHEMFIPEYRGVARNCTERPWNFCKDLACLKLTDVPVVTFQHRQRAISETRGVHTHMVPVCSNFPAYNGPPVFQEHLVGSLATFHHDFNLRVVLEALGSFPGARPLFIGDAPPALRAERSFFSGYLSPADVARQLMKIKYFVLCDRRGISTRKGSAAAALASGLCIVATRTAWTDDVFEHGKNVFFFDGTAAGLVAAIRALEADSTLASRIAQGGKDLYGSLMAPQVIAKRLAELLS